MQNEASTSELKQLNEYLSNPDNRKVRIVRDELTRYDSEMSTLQELARIGYRGNANMKKCLNLLNIAIIKHL